MDSITLDGDEVNRKGGMSGGYHDESSARLGAVERIRTLRRDLKGLDKDYKDMQQKVGQWWCRKKLGFDLFVCLFFLF